MEYPANDRTVDVESYIDRFITFLDTHCSLLTRTPDNAIAYFEHVEVITRISTSKS